MSVVVLSAVPVAVASAAQSHALDFIDQAQAICREEKANLIDIQSRYKGTAPVAWQMGSITLHREALRLSALPIPAPFRADFKRLQVALTRLSSYFWLAQSAKSATFTMKEANRRIAQVSLAADRLGLRDCRFG